VQVPLGLARLLDRMNLGPQVVGAQEVVADPEQAGGVAF